MSAYLALNACRGRLLQLIAELSWLHRVDRRHLERLCEEKKLSAEGDSEMLAERLRDNRGLSVAQLKSLCEVVGVTKQGNKADIAQRIGDKLAASAQQATVEAPAETMAWARWLCAAAPPHS